MRRNSKKDNTQRKINKFIIEQPFRVLGFFLITIYIFLLTAKNYSDDLIIYEAILTLVCNIILLWYNRKNIYTRVLFFFILYLNYSIIYPNFLNHIDNFFTTEINQYITAKSLQILCLFNCFTFVFAPLKVPKSKLTINYFESKYELNNIVVFIIIFLLIIIFFTGINRPLAKGERSDPSALYEYSLCVFILLFYFVKNRKIIKYIEIIAILFAAQNFLYGGRISGIQFLVCIYICRYSYKFSLKKVFFIAFPLFSIMYVIGALRANFLTGQFDLTTILHYILEGGFALDTAYAAYYTSTIFVFMSDKVPDHIIYFIVMIAACFIGYQRFPQYLLQNVADKFLINYKGGVLPFYFWFYFGNLGIILISFVISRFIKAVDGICYSKSGLTKCIGVYTICHVFRWYLYTPYSLFRGSLFTIILYYIFSFFIYIPLEPTERRVDINNH